MTDNTPNPTPAPDLEAETREPHAIHDGQPCHSHHRRFPASNICCCGARWNTAMTCHPCREGDHTNCADGGTTTGPGRWCSCQHAEGKVRADG